MTRPIEPQPDPQEAAPPQTPEGTRLVLASENLLEKWGTRDDAGAKITAEWGEPTESGWYEPIFTVHYDDNIAVDERDRGVATFAARLREAVEGLDRDCHDFYSEAADHDVDCSAIDRSDVLAAIDRLSKEGIS